MIIDCISDLHGFYPKLEGGDLLIVAGDLTARDEYGEYLKFYAWLHKQKYKHYIFIGGNHDNLIQERNVLINLFNTTYLCDSGIELESLKIWGSPWTLTIPSSNPTCRAFTGTEEKLESRFSLIPDDTDILITHGPCRSIRDSVAMRTPGRVKETGSYSLALHSQRTMPDFHIFGHIHEGYGEEQRGSTKFINCSHVNKRYEPVNKPIRIEL